MKIEIPDSFDSQWKSRMLLELSNQLQALDTATLYKSNRYCYLIGAMKIVQALREYSGE